MEWKDDATNLDTVAIRAMMMGAKTEPKCCSKSNVHIYCHRYTDKRGSVWAWCSNCGSFTHLDGLPINKAWVNCDDIDYHKLTAVPKYLDSVAGIVDTHFEEYQGRAVK